MDETRKDAKELGRLLREATRLVEGADLRGASETLERARAVAMLHGEKPRTTPSRAPSISYREQETPTVLVDSTREPHEPGDARDAGPAAAYLGGAARDRRAPGITPPAKGER